MFSRETVFRQECTGTSEELPFSRNSCNHQKWFRALTNILVSQTSILQTIKWKNLLCLFIWGPGRRFYYWIESFSVFIQRLTSFSPFLPPLVLTSSSLPSEIDTMLENFACKQFSVTLVLISITVCTLMYTQTENTIIWEICVCTPICRFKLQVKRATMKETPINT